MFRQILTATLSTLLLSTASNAGPDDMVMRSTFPRSS